MANLGTKLVKKVGDSVRVHFWFDVAGVLQTGLNPTCTLFDESNNSSSLTETESPTDLYFVDFTPDAAGFWKVKVEESTIPREEWRVFEVEAATVGDKLADIETDTQDIQTRLPAALVSGRMNSNTAAISDDSAAADALESILDGGGGTLTANVTGNLSGPVGSVTGAVGSVTGNVGGNVVGSIGTLAAAAVAQVNAEVDTGLSDIRLDELIQNAASPVTPTINSFLDRLASTDGTQTFDRATDSLQSIRDALAAAGPSAATIADAVWDELRAGHLIAGSYGEAAQDLYDAGLIFKTLVIAGSTTTEVRTNRNTEVNNYHNGATIIIQDGSIRIARRVITYGQTNGAFTVVALPFVPSVGATVWLVPRVITAPESIWAALRSANTVAGSFGEGVASVQGNVTGSVASVTGNVGGNVTGSVGSVVGAVGSVTGNVGGNVNGNVVGTVASVVGNLGGNVVGNVNGNVVGSVASVTGNVGGNVVGSIGTLAAAAVAQVNAEADTALADIRLDELVQNAAAPATPTIDSFIDRITSKDGVQTYDRSTDSLEAIKDSAASGGLTAQQVRDSMLLAPTPGAPAAGSVDEHLDDILADTAAMQPLIDVATSTRATNAGVDAAVTASHGVGSYVDSGAAPTVAAIDAQLSGTHGAGAWGGGGGLSQQQVRDALKLAPSAGAPAAGSIDDELDEIMGPGFDPLTDSLEEIRDEVDACCGDSGDQVNIEGI